ncbi:uncharacterized protein LOC106667930 isoform X2 [Cimex lectularius]|uniref:FAM234A/B beta-propeller domain-containing protein n=1 Tax=Cimex lectularius TaxID=79782 RepID=A0A8I6TFA6_CIMLE|nr:uncharacterized protein LOC106667930 isoform X2 [Cimex lectularius]
MAKGFVMGATLFLNLFPSPLYNFRLWSLKAPKAQLNIIPCSDFTGKDIWYKTFPWMKSEAALVMVDVNQDGIDDVIIGYSTNQHPGSCVEFPNAKDVCGGGVLALDGKTGDTLWQHWTHKDVLFVDCSADISSDKIKDCLISGKGGVLTATDGKTGKFIWGKSPPKESKLIDLYTAQFISDIDGDKYPDVLVSHTLSNSGQLAVLSGKTGITLGHLDTPDDEGIFTVPRVTVSRDGSDVVLFATGSSETSGTLFATLLSDILIAGPKHYSNVWKSDVGITSGIVLADMNRDGTEDVILTSGDTLSVLDGNDYNPLWNVSLNGFDKNQRQILIGPTPAYFDDDLIPDLLVTHMVGSSFPAIFYSQTWVANGKDGVGLLEEPILGGSEVTAPGVAISFTGIGNDMYLFWMTTCNSIANQKKSFQFLKESEIHKNARADLCRLRFNKSLEIQMYVLNQHIKPPGVLLYSSKFKWEIEHNVTEHKINKKVLPEPPKHLTRDHGGMDKLEKLRKQQVDKIYQAIPKNYPLYETVDEDRNLLNALPRFPESIASEAKDLLTNNLPPISLDYDVYSQDLDPEDPLFSRTNQRHGEVYDGRDERADFLNRNLEMDKILQNDKNQEENREKRETKDHKDGIPRATTTAALANPIDGNGIDIIFATHWIMPASNVVILSEKDDRCIKKKTSKKQSNNLKVFNEIKEIAQKECLGLSDDEFEEKEDYDGVDGQLTVYRINLSCKCSNINPSMEKCSTPLPLDQQSYSHRATNVYFKQRHKPAFRV